ncbi:hypothetical protein C8F04DRAFT_1255727 [Mycena alexandri]|uniref:Uncharacterized protein n=1 Tax=Mycena alexandri TaxID=1745969 RepID=A0AAD6T7K7_9AGAR|nr:hypothetical protein C8F04DRAFT_1255727 [Mycena alexandri]
MYSRPLLLLPMIVLAVSAAPRSTSEFTHTISSAAVSPEERAYKVFEGSGKCVLQTCKTSAQCTTVGCKVCTGGVCAAAAGRY